MLKKSFKIRARTGGIRRKISKEHARIMSSNSTNTRQKDLGEVSCDNKKEGSVGQVGSENKQDTTFSCLQKNIVNENTQQNRVHSSPLYFSENDRPQSSEESEDDSDIDKYVKCSSFRENIRRWAIEKNINQTALKDLAKIMNGLIPKILPMDPRTIVKTPIIANIKKIEGGEYWHNGITHNLILLLENWTDVPDSISLNLNFDGLPIFKSSKNEFWPILCNISENTNIKPLVIGIYYGIGKPKNLTTYLEDFIAEVNHLLDEGITLSQNCEKKITIKIRCFVCDSPARAFIKGVCNFNGKHGCMKCVTVGEYSHNSHTVTFPDTICSERTNDGFRNKLYGAHHKNDSPLLNLPIDMVKDFPVGDSLHLIDLGIMKRLLVGWRDGNFVRGLEHLAFWKGSEYRTFLFYLSIIILPDVLTSDVCAHFLKLYCGVTICSTERLLYLLPLAKEILEDFVKHYKDFYGADYVTSNVHNLIHITAEVERFGPLHSFSAYPFENELYSIKRLLRNGKNPLSQIANRIIEATTEFSILNPELSEKLDYPFLKANKNDRRVLHLKQYAVSSKTKDRYVLTTVNDIVEINNIVEGPTGIRIKGIKMSNKDDVFTYPIKSSHLHIYKVKNYGSNSDIVLDPKDLLCKLVCLHHREYLYFIPLLHTYQ
ncbi:unnamed protein product [Diatraea saccharalis]|uniref:Transposase domain-containing protein n=1 Tax=Diatraea saccharalis TaxID=40085 RepID=A0A9N9WG62_9NEOP|nr:unnamed protein product [Diatraea saccharalis]